MLLLQRDWPGSYARIRWVPKEPRDVWILIHPDKLENHLEKFLVNCRALLLQVWSVVSATS